MKIDYLSQMLGTQIWQVTALFAIVAVATFLIGKKRPHLAYLLWVIFFIKCITPPILQSPTSIYSWLESENTHSTVKATINSGPDISGPDISGLNNSGLQSADRKVAGDAKDHSQPHSESQPTTTRGTGQTPTSENHFEKLANVPWHLGPPPKPVDFRVADILFVVWAIGGIAFFVVTGSRWYRFAKRVTKNQVEVPKWLAQEIQQVSEQIGIRRPAKVILTSDSFGPFVFGWLSPQLVLPTHMTTEKFRENLPSVLAHELCHIRRGDGLISLAQWIARGLFWFHPLVWWACSQANRLCEICCDQEAIESTNIRRRDYAKCLVAVVDAKRQLRPVLAVLGMNQAEITKQRMSEIMKSNSRVKRTPFWNWLVAFSVMTIVLPSAGLQPTVVGQDLDDLPSIQMIRVALGQGDFEKAERYCRDRFEADEEDAMAVHLLGYTLHAKGELDKALKYHKLATKFDQTRGLGLYNWACVLALQGESEKALAKLEEVVEEGVQLQRPITQDTDFESLFDDDRFKKIAAALSQGRRSRPSGATESSNESATNSAKASIQEFAFWVGNWEVVDKEGKVVGHNEITMEESGNLIREKWTGANGVTGQSINYVDPADNTIKQTWVDSRGAVMELSGKATDGKMVMKGSAMLAEGKKGLCKMKITALDDGRVHQFVQISPDGGETWKTYFDGYYQSDKGEKEGTH